jgi:SH3-like domain-containing protein
MSPLFKKPNYGSEVKAKIQVNAIGNLGKCDREWCFLKFSEGKGWVNRSDLWGLLTNEIRE